MPHLSLVFAERVWKELPTDGKWIRGETDRDMYLYCAAFGKVLVGWLKHPSTRWRRNGWRDDAEIGIAQQYTQFATKFHGSAHSPSPLH